MPFRGGRTGVTVCPPVFRYFVGRTQRVEAERARTGGAEFGIAGQMVGLCRGAQCALLQP